ncbi:hypothetical protein [Methanothrix sp.]|uniref:hypothetical protein n=1 Tax=Methanothrix sp. TaxID=90426 RepID=UPI003C7142C7
MLDMIENKRRWLPLVAGVCLVMASLGLSANLLMYMIFQHQKGFFDVRPLVYINMMLCIFFVIFGTFQIIFLRKIKNYINQIETLEETVYRDLSWTDIDRL